MKYIEGTPRTQIVLFNECIDNLIGKDSPVRVIDASDSKNPLCRKFGSK